MRSPQTNPNYWIFYQKKKKQNPDQYSSNMQRSQKEKLKNC